MILKFALYLSLLSVVLLFFGLWWLTLPFIFLVFFYFLFLKLISTVKYPLLKSITKSLFFFLFILYIVIGIKLLIGDIYRIPSSSMEGTLFPNDVIIVNKLKYGPRLPRSPFDIPWINIAFYFNDKAKKRIDEHWWDYKRLSGSSNLKSGDIVVYEQFKKNTFYVKRCIGKPGDTLMVKNSHVFINHIQEIYRKTLQDIYTFKIKDKKELYKKMDVLGIGRAVYKSEKREGYMDVKLTYKEAEDFKQLKCIDSFQTLLATYRPETEFFAKPKHKYWTIDNFGPVIIPKKGFKILLDDTNYEIYRHIINSYENSIIEQRGTSFYCNGKQITDYVFKKDYCFMIGDNRKDSYDSRFIGFIPEENIVGKVQCIFFSNYQDEFQWNRFFKSTN